MSRSSTRLPRRPKAAKMRPLHVAIYSDGKLSQVQDIPDPRKLLCKEMNRQGSAFAMSAEPITAAEAARLRRQLAARKAVAHV